jgi:dTMP kinase
MLTGGHVIRAEAVRRAFGLYSPRIASTTCSARPSQAGGRRARVSDRWYHSSLAYQGTGAERDWIAMLNARARRPDLTIFLEVRPEVAAHRRAAAGRVQELFEDLRMQEEVAAGYKATIAELTAQGERIEVIDGEASPDHVFAAIVALVGV